MAIDDDLTEFVGADQKTRAVPKDFRVTDTPPPGLEKFEPPAPRVAVYNPPEPGASHPKHSILGPALRLDKAEHALTNANAALVAAARELRDAERIEADAEAAFAAELPGVSQEQALRDHANSELKARADRVAAGLSPDARSAPVHGSSVLDRNAAHRARPVPGTIAAPLQSHAVRRQV